MDLNQVRAFAVTAHGDQMYDEHPYEHHLSAVASIISGWTEDSELIAAAWLHDTLEDTAVTFDDLAETFTPRVASLVWAVTAEGEVRVEKMNAIYRKIEALPDAALVKLADRVANVEAAPAGSRHQARYAAEHERFGQTIRPHVPAEAWARMEAAFKAGDLD